MYTVVSANSPLCSVSIGFFSVVVMTALNCPRIFYGSTPAAVKGIRALTPRPVLVVRKIEIWSES
jgi:hypothetical protein